MSLEKLELSGFKSFANKTVIDFDKGITGIVGPNGSGKSNITEAIRWVLGESSAKSLRGSQMKDVIFAGSEFRKPLNRAEVTLVFDNHDHGLHIDADHVTVTRRLMRDGDSEYLINNQSVRLKDIHSLFLDSGISQDSLAIISQGKVDEILNSKPESRRMIFEEVAGVLHFKQQKQAAKIQLEKTTDNLIRINDLVKELENRVEPLHEQASLAKEYLFQKKQYDEKMQVLLAFEIADLDKQNKQLKHDLSKKTTQLTKLDEEVKISQTDLENRRSDSQKLNKQKENLQDKILTTTQQISKINTELVVTDQSGHYNDATKDEYQQQISLIQKNLTKNQQQLASLTDKKHDLQSRLIELKNKKQQLVEQFTQNPNKLQDKLEELRNDYIQILQDQTSNNNEINYLQKEILRSENTQKFETNNVSDKLILAKKELINIKDDIEKFDTELNKLEVDKKAKTVELQKISIKRNQQNKIVTELANKFRTLSARYDAIDALQKRHENYYYSVRNILNNLQLYHGVVGAVGELLEFDPKYEAAMVTALGSSVQSLVVDNQNNARDAITTLKNTHAGWATFLPLDNLRYRTISPATVTNLETLPGFVGLASQLVKASTKVDISNVINYLLGTTIVVDNIDHAVQISHHIRSRIVTLDGDVISASGAMTGGERSKKNNSPLQLNSQLMNLKKQVIQLKQKYQEESNDIKELNDSFKKISTDIGVITDKLQKLNQKTLEIKSHYETKHNEVINLMHTDDMYHKQLQLRQKTLKVQKDQIKQAKDQAKIFEQKIAQAKKAIEILQDQIKNYDIVSQKIQKQISKNNANIAIVKTNLNNVNDQISDHNGLMVNYSDQLKGLNNKLNEIGSNRKLALSQKKDYQKQLEKLETKQNQTKKELAKISQQLGKLDAQINKLNAIFTRNYDLRKNMARENEKYVAEISTTKEQLDQKLKQLASYSITYEAVLTKTDIQNSSNERQKLKKEIKLHKMSLDDIGSVNLSAIEEYDSVKTRYDFLNQQQNDLLQAKTDIEKSMSSLDQEVINRFSNTFNKIAASFQRIFPIVFGGGKANLILTEPNNMLETGIEIIAQPPGKKLQKLTLLSGGERALTAITLLFAMLDVNPVSFSILDEVEAALDEANVTRFAKFLKKFDVNTQFIVITHRQGTMELADQLYGVVMQESGVSQVLSVSLKEIKNKVR